MADSNQIIKDYISQNKEQLNRDAFTNDPSLATIYSEIAGPFQPTDIEPVANFDTEGVLQTSNVPLPPERPTDLYGTTGPQSNTVSTNDKNKDNKSVRSSGTRSEENQPEDSSDPVACNRETMALVQKGYYQRPSFYGNQSLLNSAVGFSRAIDTAMLFSTTGRTLKSSTGNLTIPRNKTTNYYLLESEKQLLVNKAVRLSQPGIVPYDCAEEFLYILVSVDNFNDLKFIADVTGVTELAKPSYVREPVQLLNVAALDRVAYLANAVAAVNKRYDPKFDSAYAVGDSSGSMYSSLLAGTSGLSLATAIPQFPGISILSSSLSSIVSSVASQIGTMALFNTIGSLSGGAFDAAFSSIMSAIGGIASSFASIGSEVLNLARSAISMGINAIGSVINSLLDISGTISKLANTLNQVAAFVTKPRLPSMMSDINGSFSGMYSIATTILSSLNSVVSAVGSLGLPTITGFALSQITGRPTGRMLGPFLSQLTIGQKIPVSVATNNPMLQPPSYAGKAFFGESPVSVCSVDQDFVRRIAPYPSASSGAGTLAFQMQNYGSFAGALPIKNVVSQLTLGLTTPPTIGPMSTYVNTTTTNVCNMLNVPTTSSVELRRSDNSIPFMIAMGSALVNDTKSPFSSTVYSDGWKTASSVGNDLQRHNRAFLTACGTL